MGKHHHHSYDDKKFCKKIDERKKDWKDPDCYEEKDYFIERKYWVKENKYLIEEKKYDGDKCYYKY